MGVDLLVGGAIGNWFKRAAAVEGKLQVAFVAALALNLIQLQGRCEGSQLQVACTHGCGGGDDATAPTLINCSPVSSLNGGMESMPKRGASYLCHLTRTCQMLAPSSPGPVAFSNPTIANPLYDSTSDSCCAQRAGLPPSVVAPSASSKQGLLCSTSTCL